jgi:hypothetical protein
MRSLILAFALLPAAAHAGDETPPGAAPADLVAGKPFGNGCRATVENAGAPAVRARAPLHSLAREPAATGYHPVLRINPATGCEDLVRVRAPR